MRLILILHFLFSDELTVLESSTVPLGHGGSKSATPSPIVGSSTSRLRRGPSSVGSPEWSAPDDEIERLVALEQQRQSTSSLGVIILLMNFLIFYFFLSGIKMVGVFKNNKEKLSQIFIFQVAKLFFFLYSMP